MKQSMIAVLITSTVAALQAGCAPTTPQYDSRFGQSVRMSMAQQVMDPDAASKNVQESMDGPAARETVVRYRNTFKEPPPAQNVFNIGVGSGSGQSR